MLQAESHRQAKEVKADQAKAWLVLVSGFVDNYKNTQYHQDYPWSFALARLFLQLMQLLWNSFAGCSTYLMTSACVFVTMHLL